MMDGDKLAGPYRATKLWNEAILMFREGMPIKKRRRHMRVHEACFSGSEAVNWFHTALLKNANFGLDVTRDQAMQLLQKFLRAGIFEKISDKNSNTLEHFKDNSSLYKFCNRSPLKNMQLPNLMGPSRNNKKPSIPQLDSSPKVVRVPDSNVNMDKKRFLEKVKAKAVSKQRVLLEEQEVWQSVVLGRLEALMGVINLEDYIPYRLVSGGFIIQNVDMASVNLFRQLDSAKEFPDWIVSAMKTLMSWPEQKCHGGLDQSAYDGFEVDVFQEVEKYFNAVETPIIPAIFYKAFEHALMYVEYADQLEQEKQKCLAPQQHQQSLTKDEYTVSSKSLENLVLEMSSPLRPSRTNPFAYPDFSPYQDPVKNTNPFADYIPNSQYLYQQSHPATTKGTSRKSLSMYQSQPLEQNSGAESASADDILSGSRILTTVLPPHSCFETAFTSESPITRIIPQRTVDTLHFQCRRRARRSEVEPKPITPSPIYVQMDKYRHPPAPTKTYREGRPNTMMRSSTVGDLNMKTKETSHSRELSSQSDVAQGRYSPLDPRYKRHSICSPSVQHSQSTPLTTGELNNRPALPPRSRKLTDVIYENLDHMKNRSGGYVNLALSYEDGNQKKDIRDVDDIAGEELDVPTALKSIFTLMQCSQGVAYSTPNNDSAFVTPIPTRLSLSSIDSCNTPLDTSPIFSDSACNTVKPRRLTELQLADDISGVTSIENRKIGNQIIQLLLLVIPPRNRKKLGLLLNFLDVIAKHRYLSLDENMHNTVILEKVFKDCLLSDEAGAMCAEDAARSDALKSHFFKFLLKEYSSVLSVPSDLKEEVLQHIREFQLEQQKSSEYSQHLQRQKQWQKHRLEQRYHPHQDEDIKLAAQATSSKPPNPVLTFCEQVTSQEFEEQKFTGSQRALFELLEQIVNDPKMDLKDKQKRLDLFKASYPHIYEKRFPTKEDEAKVLQPKTKGLLRTLSRLKNLRL